MIRRAASPWTKTVEIPLSELPPPPNAAERVRDALERAAVWAVDVGPDVAAGIAELISRVREMKGKAA